MLQTPTRSARAKRPPEARMDPPFPSNIGASPSKPFRKVPESPASFFLRQNQEIILKHLREAFKNKAHASPLASTTMKNASTLQSISSVIAEVQTAFPLHAAPTTAPESSVLTASVSSHIDVTPTPTLLEVKSAPKPESSVPECQEDHQKNHVAALEEESKHGEVHVSGTETNEPTTAATLATQPTPASGGAVPTTPAAVLTAAVSSHIDVTPTPTLLEVKSVPKAESSVSECQEDHQENHVATLEEESKYDEVHVSGTETNEPTTAATLATQPIPASGGVVPTTPAAVLTAAVSSHIDVTPTPTLREVKSAPKPESSVSECQEDHQENHVAALEEESKYDDVHVSGTETNEPTTAATLATQPTPASGNVVPTTPVATALVSDAESSKTVPFFADENPLTPLALESYQHCERLLNFSEEHLQNLRQQVMGLKTKLQHYTHAKQQPQSDKLPPAKFPKLSSSTPSERSSSPPERSSPSVGNTKTVDTGLHIAPPSPLNRRGSLYKLGKLFVSTLEPVEIDATTKGVLTIEAQEGSEIKPNSTKDNNENANDNSDSDSDNDNTAPATIVATAESELKQEMKQEGNAGEHARAIEEDLEEEHESTESGTQTNTDNENKNEKNNDNESSTTTTSPSTTLAATQTVFTTIAETQTAANINNTDDNEALLVERKATPKMEIESEIEEKRVGNDAPVSVPASGKQQQKLTKYFNSAIPAAPLPADVNPKVVASTASPSRPFSPPTTAASQTTAIEPLAELESEAATSDRRQRSIPRPFPAAADFTDTKNQGTLTEKESMERVGVKSAVLNPIQTDLQFHLKRNATVSQARQGLIDRQLFSVLERAAKKRDTSVHLQRAHEHQLRKALLEEVMLHQALEASEADSDLKSIDVQHARAINNVNAQPQLRNRTALKRRDENVVETNQKTEKATKSKVFVPRIRVARSSSEISEEEPSSLLSYPPQFDALHDELLDLELQKFKESDATLTAAAVTVKVNPVPGASALSSLTSFERWEQELEEQVDRELQQRKKVHQLSPHAVRLADDKIRKSARAST